MSSFDLQVCVEESPEFLNWLASHDPEWIAEREAEIDEANAELLEVATFSEDCPF